MYKCKQHIHELFWVASRFLKKIICNELYLCARNKDGIRRILNCKCTGDFWLLCIAQKNLIIYLRSDLEYAELAVPFMQQLF